MLPTFNSRPRASASSRSPLFSALAKPKILFGAFAVVACALYMYRRASSAHPLLSGEKRPFSFSAPGAAPPAAAAGERPRVLVTGGAGFIASHTIVELVGAGFAVTIVDNLVNSVPEAVARVRRLVAAPDAIHFVRGDVRDEAVLAGVLSGAPHVAVIHFAALKAVGESIDRPLDYYENNLNGLVTVLAAARAYGIKEVRGGVGSARARCVQPAFRGGGRSARNP